MTNHKDTSQEDIGDLFQQASSHFQMGQSGDAEILVHRILNVSPRHADASHLLGLIAIRRGHYDTAEQHLACAIESAPDRPVYHYNLGLALYGSKQYEKALAAYDRAIRLDPGFSEAHLNRGITLRDLGHTAEAVAAYEQALRLAPDRAGPHYNLGNVLSSMGRVGEALAAYDEAIRLEPRFADAHNNRGLVLKQLGRLEEAADSFYRALELNPDLAGTYNNCGDVLKELGRLEAAAQCFHRALELRPGFAEAYNNHGNVLRELGRPAEALVYYRKALELQPDYAQAHSNLLFLESAAARLAPAALLAEQQAWDRVQGAAGRRAPLPARPREALAGRRLRVGYVSPDLRGHAVSYFFAPLLAAHDRARVEVFCYATHNRAFSDATTSRLQGLAEHWRFVVDLDDAGLARRIHRDGVDILVDLAGHTGGNRLPVFTYRPAPVQATWLGFFAGTGLSAMDYWITDAVLHPADTPEQAVEQIWRLPRCWVCYEPPAVAPPVAACPHTDERVVFGSFSNLSKLTDAVIETWSALLQALPESQLLLMDKPLAEQATRERLLGRFAAHGIPGSRLLLQPGAPLKDYLGTYAKVDIVLDPFPRTGGTTTAEALWMGVPVVTLAGARYVERISAAKLAALGLEELVTHSREQYLATVEALARDPERRAQLRATLRETMARSPLCDGKGLAQSMEATYQEMWERFLSESP